MRNLEELGVLRGNNYVVESYLGGIANQLSKEYKESDVQMSDQLKELALSLLHLRYTSLLAYERCVRLSKRSLSTDGMDTYVSLGLAGEFAYYFLVSSKSCLDLTACILKAIETKQVQAGRLDDIATFRTQRFIAQIQKLREAKWYKQLIEARNMIVHKGVHINLTLRTVHEQYGDEVKRLMTLPEWPFDVQLPVRSSFENQLAIELVKTSFSGADQNSVVEGWTVRGILKVKDLNLDSLAEGMTHEYDSWEQTLAKAISREEWNSVPPKPVMSIFSYLELPGPV